MQQQRNSSSAAQRATVPHPRAKGRQKYRESISSDPDTSQDDQDTLYEPSQKTLGTSKPRQPLKPKDTNVQPSKGKSRTTKAGAKPKGTSTASQGPASDLECAPASEKGVAGKKGKSAAHTAANGAGGRKRKAGPLNVEEALVDLTQGDLETEGKDEAGAQDTRAAQSQGAGAAKRRKGPAVDAKDGSGQPQEEEQQASQKAKPAKKRTNSAVAAGSSQGDPSEAPSQPAAQATQPATAVMPGTSSAQPPASAPSDAAADGALPKTRQTRTGGVATARASSSAQPASVTAGAISEEGLPSYRPGRTVGAGAARATSAAPPVSGGGAEAGLPDARAGCSQASRQERLAAVIASLQQEPSRSIKELEKQYDDLRTRYDELKEVEIGRLEQWMEEVTATHKQALDAAHKQTDYWRDDAERQRNLNLKYRKEMRALAALQEDKRSLELQVVQVQLEAKALKEELWKEKKLTQNLTLENSALKDRIQTASQPVGTQPHHMPRTVQPHTLQASHHVGCQTDEASPPAPSAAGGVAGMTPEQQQAERRPPGSVLDIDLNDPATVQVLARKFEEADEVTRQRLREVLSPAVEAAPAGLTHTPEEGGHSQPADNASDVSQQQEVVEMLRGRVTELEDRVQVLSQENTSLEVEKLALVKAKPKMRTFICQVDFDAAKVCRSVEVQCNLMPRQMPPPTVGVLHPTPMQDLTPEKTTSPPAAAPSPVARLTYSDTIPEYRTYPSNGPMRAQQLDVAAAPTGEAAVQGGELVLYVDGARENGRGADSASAGNGMEIDGGGERGTGPGSALDGGATKKGEERGTDSGVAGDRMVMGLGWGGGTDSGPAGYGEERGTGSDPAGYGEARGTGSDPAGYGEARGTGSDPAGYGEARGTGSDPAGYGEARGTGSDPAGYGEERGADSDPARYGEADQGDGSRAGSAKDRMETAPQGEFEGHLTGARGEVEAAQRVEREANSASLNMRRESAEEAVMAAGQESAVGSPAVVGGTTLSIISNKEMHQPTGQPGQAIVTQKDVEPEQEVVPFLQHKYRMVYSEQGAVGCTEMASGCCISLRPFLYPPSPYLWMQIISVDKGRLAYLPEDEIMPGRMMGWLGDKAFLEWLDPLLSGIPLVEHPPEDVGPQPHQQSEALFAGTGGGAGRHGIHHTVGGGTAWCPSSC